jgi:hypothetical protein
MIKTILEEKEQKNKSAIFSVKFSDAGTIRILDARGGKQKRFPRVSLGKYRLNRSLSGARRLPDKRLAPQMLPIIFI